MTEDVTQILLYILLFAGVPIAALIVLHRFVRQPFMRLLQRLLNSDGTWTVSRSIRISGGPEPERALRWSSVVAEPEAAPEAADARISSRTASPATARRYQEAWRAVEARFAHDPEQAVRDAHDLVTELARELGRPAMVSGQSTFETTDLAGAAGSLRALYRQVQVARVAAHASQRVLAHQRVEPAGLQEAMRHYRRIIDDFLGRPA